MRVISDRQALQLKAATRRSIDMAGGSESFQHVTRVGQGQLSKYGLTGDDHACSFIPVDIAIEADLEAGAPVIVERMAALLGYRLVRAETSEPEQALSHRDLCRFNAEVGGFNGAADEALEDGNVDSGERRQLLKQLGPLKARLAEIEHKLVQAEVRLP